MEQKKQELIELICTRRPKEELQAICTQAVYRPYLVELCLGEDPKLNWRAAWLIRSLPRAEVQALFPSALGLIDRLQQPCPRDGYWREILKLISLLELNEEEEGLLYDAAIKIWEDLSLASAVRATALFTMAQIAEHYPELKQELLAYQDDHFLQGISPGIKKQIQRLFASLG